MGAQIRNGNVRNTEAILIAGPTASGKSKLALELAAEHDGEIINSDSMQVYPVLRVLTARPGEDDLRAVPHHLYGHAEIREPYSVALWLEEAALAFDDVVSRGKMPIFVGGTGLYFRALVEGLSDVPEIPSAIRDAVRADLVSLGSGALHARLSSLDHEGAVRLKPGDSHRISRALEVVMATGKPLSHFHNLNSDKSFLKGKQLQKMLILPERNVLHDRINARTETMFDDGAIDEVKAMLALNLPSDATALKAIGVRQLQDYILGKETLNNCTERVKAATRQYAKRQSTWFRNQFGEDWSKIP